MADSALEMAAEGREPPKRGSFLKRVLMNGLKLLIAVVGIGWVVWHVSWYDKATIAAGTEIRSVKFLDDTRVVVVQQRDIQTPGTMPASGPAAPVWVVRHLVKVRFPDTPVNVEVNGERVSVVINEHVVIPRQGELGIPRELELPLEFFKEIKKQRVEDGLRAPLLAARSRWYLLVAAWSLLVVPFLVSAVRWRALMKPQGIVLPLGKCLQLTFVGQYYSIFLPGVTGGDPLKIYYAARMTGSKTKSIVTILLDRAVGLVALMVIAGVAAGVQLLKNQRAVAVPAGLAAVPQDATLRNVLILIVVILAGMGVFALVYFSHRLRSLTGLQRIINSARMPEFVKHADEVLHRYRGHSGLMAWAFIISLCSQLMLPLSAWLSGLAFGMHVNMGYYLAYVPIAVLASSLPISPPQGIGVMDYILMHFFAERGGVAVGRVVALTQAIRLLPILWNLVGVYWVVRGDFSRQVVEEGIEVE